MKVLKVSVFIVSLLAVSVGCSTIRHTPKVVSESSVSGTQGNMFTHGQGPEQRIVQPGGKPKREALRNRERVVLGLEEGLTTYEAQKAAQVYRAEIDVDTAIRLKGLREKAEAAGVTPPASTLPQGTYIPSSRSTAPTTVDPTSYVPSQRQGRDNVPPVMAVGQPAPKARPPVSNGPQYFVDQNGRLYYNDKFGRTYVSVPGGVRVSPGVSFAGTAR